MIAYELSSMVTSAGTSSAVTGVGCWHTMACPLRSDGKEGLTKINVIRIFNVMHHIGFFVDADGMLLPKNTLFTALSNAFNCPELSDWENSLYPSRSKANSDHRAQKKIFEKMKGNQAKFFKELEKEHLDIFNRLQKEQETILNESDEKKRRMR